MTTSGRPLTGRVVQGVARVLRRTARPSTLYQPERGTGLTRESIVWGYRLFLDREPESEAAIDDKQRRCPSMAALRREFLGADEYRQKNQTQSQSSPASEEEFTIFHTLYGRRPTAEETAILRDVQRLGLTSIASCFRNVISRFDRQLQATPFTVRFTETDIDYIKLNEFQICIDKSDISISNSLIVHRHYEPHLTQFCEQHIRSGMTVVDIGANIGYYTLLAAGLVGKTGRVIAFEPNTENCRLILLSLHKNGLCNVTLYPLGLSDQAGLAFFSTHLGSNGGILLSAETTLLNPNCVVIPTMRLDELLAETPVNLLKLDTEGAEGLIVNGARNVIERDRPIISSEFSTEMLQRVSGISGRAYLDYFRSLGYRIFMIDRATAALNPINDVASFLEEYVLGRIEDLAFLPTTGPNAIS
jgi:FkbM family methyltransferase